MARLLRTGSAEGAQAAIPAPAHRPPAHSAHSASASHLPPAAAEWPPAGAARPAAAKAESDPDVFAAWADGFEDVPSQPTLLLPRPPSSAPIAVSARPTPAEPSKGSAEGASDPRPSFTWQQPRPYEELPSPGRTLRALALRDLVLRASGFIEEGEGGRR